MSGFYVLEENKLHDAPNDVKVYHATKAYIPSFEGDGTAYIYNHGDALTVYSGTANRRYRLRAQEYGRIRLPIIVSTESSNVSAIVVITQNQATRLTGGPIESEGRLKYIDGCTDSLLLPPDKIGEPCLNHLHFPPGIDQTSHTHPTVRVGMITRGRGACVHDENETTDLITGQAFCLVPEAVHKFQTTDETMDVIAFHPDSDTGPSDENHPMVNRTYVNGVSASQIDAIRTK